MHLQRPLKVLLWALLVSGLALHAADAQTCQLEPHEVLADLLPSCSTIIVTPYNGTYQLTPMVLLSGRVVELQFSGPTTFSKTIATATCVWFTLDNASLKFSGSGSLEVQGCGLATLSGNATLSQEVPLGVKFVPLTVGAGVVVTLNGGTWTQAADVTLKLSNSSGVLLSTNATWHQQGHLDASLSGTVGVSFSGNGLWNQTGGASFVLGAGAIGANLESGGVWEQVGSVTFDVDDQFGVIIDDVASEWNQYGTLDMQTNSSGVDVRSGRWTQWGDSTITSQGSSGVSVTRQGAEWVQNGVMSINMVRSTNNMQAFGVTLDGGRWTSASGSSTTIVANLPTFGVMLYSGTLDQSGRLNITIDCHGHPAGFCSGVCMTPAVSKSAVWMQNQTTTIRVMSAYGVLLGNAQAQWQQAGSTVITIQGNATGVMMSQEVGSWFLRSKLTVDTVAESSSPSHTFGFRCNGSQSCCAQAQDLSSVSFSSGGGAATRDDCPQASPSSTPAVVAPSQVINTTATFSNSTPSVSVTGTTKSGNSNNSPPKEVGVTLSLANVLDSSSNNASLTPAAYTVRQVVANNPANNVTTWVYEAPLDNSTNLAQAFTFHPKASTASFAGTEFAVGAGSVKWSLNFTSSSSDSSSGSAGFMLHYDLVALLSQAAMTTNGSSSSSSSAVAVEIIRKDDTPKRDMTTYLVRLGAASDNSTNTSTATQTTGAEVVVVAVEVFDVALVDGLYARLVHNLVLVNSTTTTTTTSAGSNVTKAQSQSQLRLELELPGFKQSLEYDPSLSLGLLLSGSTQDGGSGGSGDDNTALIVATAVAIPVAVALVVGVILVASLVWWQRSRARRSDLDLTHAIAEQDENGDDNL